MKLHCFLAAALAMVASLSQAQTDQLPPQIEKGRILTADGQKITFVNLTAGGDNHSYKTAAGHKAQTIPADNVMRVEQQTGTEAGKWALWLGLSGLVGSVLGVMSANNDLESLGANKVNGTPIILGFTAGSALIGAAIGGGKKKYKTIYSNPKYNSTSSAVPIRVGLACLPYNGLGVGLNCKF